MPDSVGVVWEAEVTMVQALYTLMIDEDKWF